MPPQKEGVCVSYHRRESTHSLGYPDCYAVVNVETLRGKLLEFDKVVATMIRDIRILPRSTSILFDGFDLSEVQDGAFYKAFDQGLDRCDDSQRLVHW